MRTIEIPKLEFGQWCHWSEIGQIANLNFPGVYALAITSEHLSGKSMKYNQVSYIGMSNSLAGIKGRLSQLNRSINGKFGHSGGRSIRNKYGVYIDWKANLYLYVSICPVICDVSKRSVKDLQLMGAVSYMEYEAFSLFRKKVPKKGIPEFNTR